MSAEILSALVAATGAITLALVVIVPARRALRRVFGAGAAYAAWLAVPLAVVAALLPLPRASVGAALALPVVEARTAIGAAAAALAPAQTTAFALVAIWLAGVVLAIAVVCRRQARFAAALGVLRAAAHGRWHASHASVGPFVTGLVTPRIVLPDDFRARYTPRERRLILAHEGEHVRHGDVRVNALAALACCAFWFHPLVHLAHARFRLDQELARDADVLARFRKRAGAMPARC